MGEDRWNQADAVGGTCRACVQLAVSTSLINIDFVDLICLLMLCMACLFFE